VDGRQITGTDVAEIEHGGAVAVANLIVHVLTKGSVYDGGKRLASIPQQTLLVD